MIIRTHLIMEFASDTTIRDVSNLMNDLEPVLKKHKSMIYEIRWV